MNATEYFHLLAVVSHRIIGYFSGKDIVQFERACGNESQLAQFQYIVRGNTIYGLTYQLHAAQWIMANHVYPTKVLINKHWDECDMAIFSEVVSTVREIRLQGASATSKQLISLIRFCQSPQRLSISSPTSLCETELVSLVNACARGSQTLIDLEFHIMYLKRTTLIAILKSCPALQALNVRKCMGLTTSETLQDILTYCPHISSISVDKFDGATDDILPSLAITCKQLTAIHFEGEGGISVDLKQLPVFFAQCGPLKRVVLSGLVVSNATMSSLAARSTQTLTVLHYTMNSTFDLTFEAHFTHLRELDMTLRHYQDADQIIIDIVQHCSRLEVLIQRNCDLCTDAAVTAIATHCTQLQKLGLFRCLDISPHALNHLVRCCGKLTLLHLTRIKSSPSEVAAMVTHCTQLTSFRLGEPFLTRWDVALYAIAAQMKCLKHLYLSGYHLAVSDTTVLHVITVCKSLQTLHIQHPDYVCKDVAIVRAMDHQCGSRMKEFRVTACTAQVYRELVLLQLRRAGVKEDFTFIVHIAVHVGCC